MRYQVALTIIVAVLSLTTRAWSAEPRSEFFTAADGAKLHYLTLGDEGSWVVLIHGISDSARRMWVGTGVVEALAKNHRVVALDCRGHGESRETRGGHQASDVVDLMKHLKADKAHIHGYSLGGVVTGRLLVSNPELFITGGLHGSGITETDPEARQFGLTLDAAARAKAPPAAPGTRRGGRGASAGPMTPQAAGRAGVGRGDGGNVFGGSPSLDLAKLDIPLLFINGSLDNPYSRVSKPLREAKVAEFVVLEGKTHTSAIGVGGPMPAEFIEAMVKFIDANDKKP